MARDRNAMRERLTGRLQSGGLGSGFGLPLKAGTPLWTPDNGSHIIDIMPYWAGPNDPVVKEGEETYILELFIHQNVGVQEGQRICLQQTYGKPCPVCEDRARRQREGEDEKVIKSLTPSRYPRTLYDVIVGDTNALINEGHKIFHTSFWLLEIQLREMAKRVTRPGDRKLDPYIAFMDLVDGKSVAFKKQGERENTKFVGIRFEDRDYKYDEDEIDRAISVDSCIIVPTYQDLELWYFGEEGDKAGSFRGTGARRLADDEGGGSSRRTTREPDPKPSADDDDKDRSTGRRSTREPEKEKEKEKEEGDGRRSSRRSADDDSDKDHGRGKDDKCPNGHEFGKDVDAFPKDCKRCEEWEACVATAEANKKKDPAPTTDKEQEESERPRRRGGAEGEGTSGRRSTAASEEEPEGGSRRKRSADDDAEKEPEGSRRRRG